MKESIASSTIVPPDVASSSHEYAERFSGPVGEYFLDVQKECIQKVLVEFIETNSNNLNVRILELGGGHCQLTDFYLNLGYSVTIQGSDERSFTRALDLGYGNNPKVSFKISPLDRLNFNDSEFDLVSGIRLMAHVKDWRFFLKEMLRVSSQGIVFDYARLYTLNYFSPLLFQIKKRIEGNTRPFYCQSKSCVKEELKKLGCTKINTDDQFAFPMGLHRLVAKPELSSRIEKIISSSGLGALKTPGVVFAKKNSSEPSNLNT